MKPWTKDEGEALRRFGAAVRAARLQQDLSQEELAFRCELSQAYLSGIEAGRRNPSLVNVLRIARGLGVQAQALLGG